MYLLRIKVLSEVIREFYEKATVAYEGDSGIDLYCPEIHEIPQNTTYLLDLQIQCEMIESDTGKLVSYYLYPRSSLSKKHLIMHNSVGIIDSMYRGNLKVPLRCLPFVPTNEYDPNVEHILFGERYVQICAPNLGPIKIELVNELSKTIRGDKGFGSSGK